MEIPEDLSLSVEEISRLKHSQLAVLTGIPPSYFSAWKGRRGISERKLAEVAGKIGLSPSDLLQVLEARRKAAEKDREAQAKGDRLIDFLHQQRRVPV